MTTDPNLATPEPSIGRIVLFVLNEGPCAGETRPAIVVRASGRTLNLQLFLDGTNDLPNGGVLFEGKPDAHHHPGWKTSVAQDQEGKRAGTWHWMPYQLTKESVASKEAPAAEKHTDKIEKPVAEKTKHK